ncbi:hypothetical protein E2R51_00935 [Jeotgalibacillus sp. S-D1]|uniref:hypothetical protein n=1 Tax=Jeotgalibacillus sp. S-D1 TaxID=2552189 RepID=UPI00105A36C0|nr:hypothetical protein [Jeotgalibacillus sp. S-D1]TDL34311.1 hypothetical protein E2R51_00935 [Jeotgalibacillus sp. S-D1]
MWISIAAGIACFIIFLILYVFFSKIRLQINMIKTGQNDRIDFKLKLFNGLYRKEMSIPFIKEEGGTVKYEKQSQTKSEKTTEHGSFSMNDIETAKQKYNQFLKRYKHAKQHINELLKKTSLEKWSTEIHFGVGAADYTALLSSLIWMTHSWCRLLLERKIILACQPSHRVVPLYGITAFKMSASCIVSIRLGHLMIIGVRLWLDRGQSKQKKVGEFHGASY